MSGKMIIADGCEYSMDCYETKLNNNVIVVGGSGAGKTTGVVIPNLLQAYGSYIVTDPKGNLYKKYGRYLKSRGYKVMNLNPAKPDGQTRYNFMDYIKDEQDVVKLSHMIVASGGGDVFHNQNSYFYYMAELFLSSAIATVKYVESFYHDETYYHTMSALLRCCVNTANKQIHTDNGSAGSSDSEEYKTKEYDLPSVTFEDETEEDDKWNDLSKRLLITTDNLAVETASSIMSTLGSVIGRLNTEGVEKMMLSANKAIDFEALGKTKTAIFVTVSDNDRSMDVFVNMFFTQAMQTLCEYADTKCKDEALPVPVRFIMDDFATNCTIEDFPRMISAIRSRNISVMLMLQAESQLEKRYGKEAFTIISNCDTYLYMGGNDLETAKRIAERADVPYKKILYMPVGTNWIFRRGQMPFSGITYGYSIPTIASPRSGVSHAR